MEGLREHFTCSAGLIEWTVFARRATIADHLCEAAGWLQVPRLPIHRIALQPRRELKPPSTLLWIGNPNHNALCDTWRIRIAARQDDSYAPGARLTAKPRWQKVHEPRLSPGAPEYRGGGPLL